MRIYFISFLFLSITSFIQAQNTVLDFGNNSKIVSISEISSFSANPIISSDLEQLGLTSYDELRIKDSNTGRNGMHHHRYQQYYKDIPVIGGQYLYHTTNGKLTSITGAIVERISLDSEPTIIDHRKKSDRLY